MRSQADENNVKKVQEILFKDSDLSIEFWTVIEKAIAKAGVEDFTVEDRIALLRLMAARMEELLGGGGPFPGGFCFYRDLR